MNNRYWRKPIQRPKLKLVRGSDGRLRQSTGEGDIGDIWAEQKRIRLAEAIEEDKRRAEKKEQRKAKLASLIHKIKNLGGHNFNKGSLKFFDYKLKTLKPPLKIIKIIGRSTKKRLLAVAVAVSVIVLSVSLLSWFRPGDSRNKQASARKGVLEARGGHTPAYQTVLPKGKTIESLGGWARVSPLDKDPVFAYLDTVAGVQLSVSQQPLPENFRQDRTGELSKLAQQFNAQEKFEVDGKAIYVGTSAKGPQSAVFTIKDLLVLVRSSAELSKEQWVSYIATLE